MSLFEPVRDDIQRYASQKCTSTIINGRQVNVCYPTYDKPGSRFFPNDSPSGEKFGRFYYNNIHPPKYGWFEQYRIVRNSKLHICRERDRGNLCTQEFNPVCGVDLKTKKFQTYPNSCQACSNPNVNLWVRGRCRNLY